MKAPLMRFSKYGRIKSLLFNSFTGMSPLVTLFFNKSFTILLTKPSVRGLEDRFFAAFNFYLIFLIFEIIANFLLFFSILSKVFLPDSFNHSNKSSHSVVLTAK